MREKEREGTQQVVSREIVKLFPWIPRCMLICLRYLSCLCFSVYLIVHINRAHVGRFRPTFLNARTFSSAVDSVGLASTIHTILYILFVTLPVLLVVSLQSSVVQ